MNVVAVVGLGYVGLPLAVAFKKNMLTIGYDLGMPKLNSYYRCTVPSGAVYDIDLPASSKPTSAGEPVTPSFATFHPLVLPSIHISDSIGAPLTQGGVVIHEPMGAPGATAAQTRRYGI